MSLAQGLEVTLIDASGAEPLEDAGRLLVDLFDFRLGNAQANRLLFQQFAVVEVHPEPLGQSGRKAGLAGPQFPREGQHTAGAPGCR